MKMKRLLFIKANYGQKPNLLADMNLDGALFHQKPFLMAINLWQKSDNHTAVHRQNLTRDKIRLLPRQKTDGRGNVFR